MVPEAMEAVEAEWDPNPSLKRLVKVFFLGFESLLLRNPDAKLAFL